MLPNEIEINTLKSEIHNNRLRIRELKYQSKIKFRKEYRKIFFAFDIFIALIILSNLGALLITNALVVKVEPEKEFYEANPVTAEMYDYEVHPEAKETMSKFLVPIYIWTAMTIAYLLARNNIRSRYWLSMLGFYIIFYMFALGTDFINNLGYFIGVKLYG